MGEEKAAPDFDRLVYEFDRMRVHKSVAKVYINRMCLDRKDIPSDFQVAGSHIESCTSKLKGSRLIVEYDLRSDHENELIRTVLLKLGFKFGYDLRSNSKVFCQGLKDNWIVLQPDHYSIFINAVSEVVTFDKNRMEVATFFPNEVDKRKKPRPALNLFNAPDARIRNTVNVLCLDNKFDPFVRYMDHLAADDGDDLLCSWLSSLLIPEEGYEDLLSWASEFIPTAAVVRAYKPGTKIDAIPVFVGPGGIGKSSVFKFLLPNHLRNNFYCENATFSNDVDKMVNRTLGCIISEFPELSGLKKMPKDEAKAWCSAGVDRAILKWKNAEYYPRMGAFFGTSNRMGDFMTSSQMTDKSWTRRFVPICVSARFNDKEILGKYEEFHSKYRDKIWAQAHAKAKQNSYKVRLLSDEDVINTNLLYRNLTDNYRKTKQLIEYVEQDLMYVIRAGWDDENIHFNVSLFEGVISCEKDAFEYLLLKRLKRFIKEFGELEINSKWLPKALRMIGWTGSNNRKYQFIKGENNPRFKGLNVRVGTGKQVNYWYKSLNL